MAMSEAREIELVFEPLEEGGYHVYAPDSRSSQARRWCGRWSETAGRLLASAAVTCD
jgi:hypothetical protein